MLCSAYKLEEGGSGELLLWQHLSFQVRGVMEPCCPGNGLPMGRGECVHFALLERMAFLCQLNWLSQPMNFLPLTLLVLSPVPLEGSERVAAQAELPAGC